MKKLDFQEKKKFNFQHPYEIFIMSRKQTGEMNSGKAVVNIF